VLRANAEALGVTADVKIIAADAFSLASRGVAGMPFTLLMLDPPYTLDPSAVSGLLEKLTASGGLAEGCVVTFEHATGIRMPLPHGLRALQTKRYGSTEVDFAVYEGEASTR
jgi:16S rRNA (guanine966-N2)-methyltransferase